VPFVNAAAADKKIATNNAQALTALTPEFNRRQFKTAFFIQSHFLNLKIFPAYNSLIKDLKRDEVGIAVKQVSIN